MHACVICYSEASFTLVDVILLAQIICVENVPFLANCANAVDVTKVTKVASASGNGNRGNNYGRAVSVSVKIITPVAVRAGAETIVGPTLIGTIDAGSFNASAIEKSGVVAKLALIANAVSAVSIISGAASLA